MLVTVNDARKIIKKHYPNMQFKITKSCQIGVRPDYETIIGLPTLAWHKLDRGKDSVVKIGVMLPNGSINWNASL